MHEFSVIMSSSGKVIPEIVTSSNATMWITVNTYYLQFVEGFSAALSQYHQRGTVFDVCHSFLILYIVGVVISC